MINSYSVPDEVCRGTQRQNIYSIRGEISRDPERQTAILKADVEYLVRELMVRITTYNSLIRGEISHEPERLTHTHTHARTHARTHAQTRTHTYT